MSEKCEHKTRYHLDNKYGKIIYLAIRGGSQDEWINNMQNKPAQGTTLSKSDTSNLVDVQKQNQDMVMVVRKLGGD
jgi:hypothetical protein